MEHLKKYVISEFERFLREDNVEWDIAGRFFAKKKACFEVLLKEEAYVPELFMFRWILEHYGIDIIGIKESGFFNNATLFKLKGDASTTLALERTFLNLLSHFLGIATITRKAVLEAEKISPDTRIAATRKTYPGLRFFEKMTVYLAGGDTHRFSLRDMIMLKDNHIALWGKDIGELIRKVRKESGFSRKIEVEVSSISMLKEVLKEDVDIVMLDNFSPLEVREAMDIVRSCNKNITVEVSGGITLENLKDYLTCKVDVISMGSIIHSAPWINVSMEVCS